jgi:hypothetical protein
VGAGQFDADLSAAIFARVLVDQRFDIDLRGAQWRNADGYRERHVAGGGGQRSRGMRASKVELQADLDGWIKEYNEARPHQGRSCFGKTPMQTF